MHMADMPFRRPKLQSQFNPRDNTARYDCTAACGGMMADADSRGEHVFSHATVRAATNEPRPSPTSPGLTIHQVADAVAKLTHNEVVLTVYAMGSPWAKVPEMLQEGAWALLATWRGVLVDAGFGGSATFRGGHAVLYGFDQDEMEFICGDPLVPRWQAIPPTVMQRACRQFLLAVGAGVGTQGAYYGLSRDVFDDSSEQPTGGDTMYNIGPSTTHRDAVLKAGTVLYSDSALTTRHSAVDKQTNLGFLGSGQAFHVVGNSGNSNYVRRADVIRIINFEREYE